MRCAVNHLIWFKRRPLGHEEEIDDLSKVGKQKGKARISEHAAILPGRWPTTNRPIFTFDERRRQS